MTTPYLSLTMICGDDGAAGIGKLFESLLYRPDGCPFDEVIVGWNGKDDTKLKEALYGLRHKSLLLGDIGPIGQDANLALKGGIPLTILRQEWKGDFAVARNEVLAHAKGEWWCWLDTDDVLSSAADTVSTDGLSAINAVEATFGCPPTPPPGGPSDKTSTLKDWLRGLAWNINCILCPYDYALSPDGKALVRQFMRRVMRRNANWLWHSPDGIHELPYPTGATAEVSIQTFGILVRHHPNKDQEDRLKRNREIVQKMTVPGNFADGRHAYDLATVHIGMSDYSQADEAIKMAIQKSSNDEDTYRYRITRSSIKLNMGQYEQALGEAFAAISLNPERSEGYYIASECFYLMTRWEACAHWYEEGRKRKMVPQTVDIVINRVVKTRALAAHAYTERGNVERAFELAKEAIEAFPLDALAQRIFKKAAHDLAKKKSVHGVMDALDFLLGEGDPHGAEQLVDIAKDLVSFRGIETLPRFQLLEALVEARLRQGAAFRTSDVTKELDAFEKRQPTDSRITYFPGPCIDAVKVVHDTTFDGDVGGRRQRRVIEVAEVEPYSDKGYFVAWAPTQKPEITIYAPHTVTPWDPTSAEHFPLGGSESAVVYLGQALARRGYPIRLYCPGGGANPRAEKGILWYGLHQFNATKQKGVLIAHRCPWILRNPVLQAPTYVWHQDNGYGNPWNWNAEIVDRMAGSLHVSEWAKKGLVSEIPAAQQQLEKHHVIGNGVCPEWKMPKGDDPVLHRLRGEHRIIYASDPTRGLETLLNCWPSVLEKFPDAELHLFCDFAVTAAMMMSHGIAVPATKFVADMNYRMQNTPRVFSHGRIPHKELTDAMLQASVYAYAGGPMPEGFGVSLAQASAAGMQVVFPNAGALPEVLPNHDWMVPEVLTEDAAKGFLEALLDALAHPMSDPQRLAQAEATLARHDWERVADRFEAAVFGQAAAKKEAA